MRAFPVIVVAVVAANLLGGPVALQSQTAPADSAKAGLIRQALQLTRAAELAIAAMETAIPVQRAANPQIPGEFWDEFTARVRRDAPQLVKMRKGVQLPRQ